MPLPETLDPKRINAYWQERERLILSWLRLDLTALPHSTYFCLVCKGQVTIPARDAFIPFSVWVHDSKGPKRTKLLKTNKAAIKWFQDTHFEACLYPKMDAKFK